MEQTVDIGKLAANLEAATAAYNEAKRLEQVQRSATTDALNALNIAQRAFTEAVTSMQNKAPPGSDWKNRAREMAV